MVLQLHTPCNVCLHIDETAMESAMSMPSKYRHAPEASCCCALSVPMSFANDTAQVIPRPLASTSISNRMVRSAPPESCQRLCNDSRSHVLMSRCWKSSAAKLTGNVRRRLIRNQFEKRLQSLMHHLKPLAKLWRGFSFQRAFLWRKCSAAPNAPSWSFSGPDRSHKLSLSLFPMHLASIKLAALYVPNQAPSAHVQKFVLSRCWSRGFRRTIFLKKSCPMEGMQPHVSGYGSKLSTI